MAAPAAGAMFQENKVEDKQSTSLRAFTSTVSFLMPGSALALMAHIMLQIMESYTAAVGPIWAQNNMENSSRGERGVLS